MKSIWNRPGSWLAVTAVAVLLALGTPHHTGVMGRLPGDVGRHLVKAPAAVPQEGGERLLALVTFHRDQRAQVDSWIQGMALDRTLDVRWVRMPVFDDPGDAVQRDAKEGRLRLLYAGRPERDHLVPVFTDRVQFMETTGVQATDQAVVLVITRDGEVLARAYGPFDEEQARHLRATLANEF